MDVCRIETDDFVFIITKYKPLNEGHYRYQVKFLDKNDDFIEPRYTIILSSYSTIEEAKESIKQFKY